VTLVERLIEYIQILLDLIGLYSVKRCVVTSDFRTSFFISYESNQDKFASFSKPILLNGIGFCLAFLLKMDVTTIQF